MHLHHTRRLTQVLMGLTALSALASCSDDERPPALTITESPAVPDVSLEDACVGKDDGEACGDERHCVAERCLTNTCGDGVRAGAEACDDGNAMAGDGCTPACNVEYTLCPSGEYVLAGSACPGDEEVVEEPELDAGPGEDCTRASTLAAIRAVPEQGKQDKDLEARPATLALIETAVEVTAYLKRGGVGQEGRFIWRAAPAKVDGVSGELPQDWSYHMLTGILGPTTTFTCPSTPGTYEVMASVLAPGCSVDTRSLLIYCVEKL